jgi:hypothetical protein
MLEVRWELALSSLSARRSWIPGSIYMVDWIGEGKGGEEEGEARSKRGLTDEMVCATR